MSKRPVIPASDRPTLQLKRRNAWQFLGEEWGLVALAAALTVMTWYITRLDVEDPHVLQARMVLTVDDPESRIALIWPGKIPIKVHCSPSEFEEARAALAAQKNEIRVQVDARRVTNWNWQALDETICTFDYPFRLEYLDGSQKPEVRGFVYQVQRRTFQIEKPRLQGRPVAGESVDIAFVSESQIELKVPEGAVDETIRPDPIDLAAIRDAQQGGEVTRPLKFNDWAMEPKDDAVRLFRMREILPRLINVQVKVRFGRIVEEKVTNRAVYDVPNAEWYSFDVKSRYDAGLNVDEPDSATLPLKAPEALLRALSNKELQEGWFWTIRFVSGELPLEGEPPKTMRAEIVFTPVARQFQDPRIVFEAPSESKGFEVIVERPKRN